MQKTDKLPIEAILADSLKTLTELNPRVEFYPYARLTNTIRSRDGDLLIRLSDILKDAPIEVLNALLLILLCKLEGKLPPKKVKNIYLDYIHRSQVRDRAQQIRRSRGHKKISHPRGKVFDLRYLLEKLNARYFGNSLRISYVGWSLRASRRVLGHYDRAYDTIVINRRIDNPLVPEYVVSYVLYHEMLHAHLGEERAHRKRMVHHRRFREAEKDFKDLDRAQRFINEHFSRTTV